MNHGATQLVRGERAWRRCRARRDGAPHGTVATIGNFDGLHRGHVAMLEQLRGAAGRTGLPSVLVSFEPLPREHFSGTDAPHRLQGLRDRVASLGAARIDALLLLEFDAAMAALSPQTFIDRVLIDTLQVRHLVIGDDFRFGHARAGDIDTLRDAAVRHGFTLERSTTIALDGERVSSTRIRAALRGNDLALAERLLGRPYRISGRVVHGEKVGRQLGFPTANVALQGLRPPLAGVFAVRAHDLDTGKAYPAVANLGERPTVGGRKLLLEVHALDGSPELYGHHLAVDFHHFIRGEQRFGSLDELKAQIALDAQRAHDAFA